MILWTSCFQICSIPITLGTKKKQRQRVPRSAFHLFFAHNTPKKALGTRRAAQRQRVQHTAPRDRRSPAHQWECLFQIPFFPIVVLALILVGQQRRNGKFSVLRCESIELNLGSKMPGKGWKSRQEQVGQEVRCELVVATLGSAQLNTQEPGKEKYGLLHVSKASKPCCNVLFPGPRTKQKQEILKYRTLSLPLPPQTDNSLLFWDTDVCFNSFSLREIVGAL